MRKAWSLALIAILSACQSSKKESAENDSDPFIVGGLDFSSVPAVGVLTGKKVRCTGTLVSPVKVVTAAHCLKQVESPEELSFSIGPNVSKPQTTLRVKAMSAHPHFKSRGSFNDIATLELAEPAPASVKPLNMVAAGDSSWQAKQRIFVIGYGYSDGLAQKGSGVKRAVWMPITELSPLKILSDPKDGKSTCQGDSGGPAFVQASGAPEGFALVGVTIAGSDSRCKGSSIFLRVDAYRAFIDEGRPEPGPTEDPCAALGESSFACSEDGVTPSAGEGRYALSCSHDPWNMRLVVKDCESEGKCRRGRCEKVSP